ncbi:MAG: chemotaxis protein CheW [Promethearchaeota archaeon]
MATKEDIQLFINESEDLIQKVEDEVLKLEENPRNTKPIQELFFAFHTLKGLTAMAGFNNVSKFCHFLEDFLNKAKNNKVSPEKISSFTSIFFESLDVLRTVVTKVKKGDNTDIDVKFLEEIKDTFEDFDNEYEITFIKPIPQDKIKQTLSAKNNNYFKIYIRLQATCVFKKVRLFIIFRALNEIGQICYSNPEPRLLEIGNFDRDFEIYFITPKTSAQISQILEEILEIDNKVITELTREKFEPLLTNFSIKQQTEKTLASNIESQKVDTYEEEFIDGEIEPVSKIVDDFQNERTTISRIKVDIDTLEKLMDYFGELIIIKNQISQILKERQEQEISILFDNIDKSLLDIQEIIFDLKLVRVESTFRKYKRLVRDVAIETGKKIKFILEGINVEMDRKILEELNSPLIHLLRNAIYHGIESPKERISKNKNETGILKLKTYRRAGLIYIEISDDGKGINYDKIRENIVKKGYYTPNEVQLLSNEVLNKFLLMPGFSTLSDADLISGRGMGLAIVDEKVKKLGGSFQIFTEKGIGTKFTVIVPFSRAIIKAQLLKIAGDIFAIPTENIKQIYFYSPELVEYVEEVEFYKINSKDDTLYSMLPIIQLDKLLKLNSNGKAKKNSHTKLAILCQKDENSSAILVADEILEQIDAVVKPFQSEYSITDHISGSTILNDGSICLILDVFNIINSKLNELQYSQLSDIY